MLSTGRPEALESSAASTVVTDSSSGTMGRAEGLGAAVELDALPGRGQRGYGRVGARLDGVRADADAHAAVAEPDPQLERVPSGREHGVDRERVARGSQAGESERERPPDAAHRGEVQPAGGHVPDVVEVDPGGEAEHLERFREAAGAGEQRGVHAGRERAAVGGARPVEVEVGLERAGWPPRRGRGSAASARRPA